MMIPCEVVEEVVPKAPLQEDSAEIVQEQPEGAVSIPCEVVVANYEAPVAVSHALDGIRAVPANGKSKQLVRQWEDTVADAFTVFFGDTGLPVNVDLYDFIFTLRRNSNVVYRLKFRSKDSSTGTVSFAPSMAQAQLRGFFTYSVQVTNAVGEMKTIVDGSYVYQA